MATACVGVSMGQILPPKCGVAPQVTGLPLTATVVNLTVGGYDRCYTVLRPTKSPWSSVPVLFWFHGAGGNARFCGGEASPDGSSLAALAAAHGFGLVCGEAVQYNTPREHGGQWLIPEVATDTAGTNCSATQPEMAYIVGVLASLGHATDPPVNVSRLYTAGCSMGSAFSIYSATCLATTTPGVIAAFATHSTGLKVKGDGNNFPPDNYNPQYGWGECPACQYFPAAVAPRVARGLKACVFDSFQDPNPNEPFFFRSSQQLVARWAAAGGRAEPHYHPGGHCAIQSFADIVQCLDDDTGRLAPNRSAV